MATRTFEAGDIIRVPFPYNDRPARQRRPALVVASRGLGPDGALLWVSMITAAENRGWPGDVEIDEPGDQTGLPIPSIIRTEKIATVEASDIEIVGRASRTTLDAVRAGLRRHLGLSA